jgi:hypothetical protein
MVVDDDPLDRKRRFLRGLNRMLGFGWRSLEVDVELVYALKILGKENFRQNLANIYGLEFTTEDISNLAYGLMTTRQFTEEYCPLIYLARGDVGINDLILSSLEESKHGPAINCQILDRAHKYGLNGSEWCDVAYGPCSCGAYHPNS